MEPSATSSSTSPPTKRRALAPLDANALGTPKNLFKPALGHSPVKMAIEGRKRLLDIEGTAPAGKRACLGRDEVCSITRQTIIKPEELMANNDYLGRV
jgi:hypothetical protein